jgi:hypothetical protein
LFSNAFQLAPANIQGVDAAVQIRRNFRLALALAAYRSQHGRYPPTLADLPAEPPVNTDDIFSGKPLIYRPSQDGYMLYSVGPNGRDDGGRHKADDPMGGSDDLGVGVSMPIPVRLTSSIWLAPPFDVYCRSQSSN